MQEIDRLRRELKLQRQKDKLDLWDAQSRSIHFRFEALKKAQEDDVKDGRLPSRIGHAMRTPYPKKDYGFDIDNSTDLYRSPKPYS